MLSTVRFYSEHPCIGLYCHRKINIRFLILIIKFYLQRSFSKRLKWVVTSPRSYECDCQEHLEVELDERWFNWQKFYHWLLWEN